MIVQPIVSLLPWNVVVKSRAPSIEFPRGYYVASDDASPRDTRAMKTNLGSCTIVHHFNGYEARRYRARVISSGLCVGKHPSTSRGELFCRITRKMTFPVANRTHVVRVIRRTTSHGSPSTCTCTRFLSLSWNEKQYREAIRGTSLI